MKNELNLGIEDAGLQIGELKGFTACLNELYKYLEEKTGFNPAKRYIDAVELLEVIINTTDKIKVLTDKANAELKNGTFTENLKNSIQCTHSN